MKQFLWKSFGLAVLSALFISCSDEDEDMNMAKARVMVVHASPDGPAVDVRVNNAVALTSLTYPGNSSYATVDAGQTNIKVSPAGTTTYVIDASLNLQADKNYSVFAIDSVSKIKAAVVADDLSAPAAGKAHVRFFHFSPNAPAVDIAVAGGPVLFSNRKFNDQGTDANVSAFTPVDAGSYNLEVRVAGTPNAVLSIPNVTLASGKIYTVFAKGFLGGMGAQALGAQIIMNN